MQKVNQKINTVILHANADQQSLEHLKVYFASTRKELLEYNLSLVLQERLAIDEAENWTIDNKNNLQKADFVMVIGSNKILKADKTNLQKILPPILPDKKKVMAILLTENSKWFRHNFKDWLAQNWTVSYINNTPAPLYPFNESLQQTLLKSIFNLSHELLEDNLVNNTYTHYEKANQYFRNKNWEQAINHYMQAMEHPFIALKFEEEISTKVIFCQKEIDFADWVRWGKSAMKKEKYLLAYDYFSHALDLKISSEVMLLKEACMRTPIPGYKVIKQLSKEVCFHDCLAEGDALFKLKEWQKAHEKYDEALRMHDFDFNYNISDIHRKLKACRTEHCFNEYFSMAKSAYRSNQHEEALIYFDKALVTKYDKNAERLQKRCAWIIKMQKLVPVINYLSLTFLILTYIVFIFVLPNISLVWFILLFAVVLAGNYYIRHEINK